MVQKRSNSRDIQRAATREKVYLSALDVFRRDGVEAARIEDISSDAGVSRGTFYFHFATKDDVLLELLQRSEGQLVEELNALDEAADFEQVLRSVAVHIAGTWADEPELLAGVGMVSMRSASTGRITDAREAHPVRYALIPHIERAMERGEIINLLPADITVDFFLMNMFGMALAWVSNDGADLAVLLDAFVSFFLRAIRT
ncbi:MAG: TetR/AcrR family transcriptional regulator [Proteobacteria bacterium]|nr:TetR/AcrR family transcriptional regulator [Pseudomonadota bacterium]